MSRKRKNNSYSASFRRLSFPGEEKIHPWLSMLIDAYCIVDKGVARAIGDELKKGRKIACEKGCSHCCTTHQDIPVYPMELVGLSWYVTEKKKGPEREALKRQLRFHNKNDPCPFLLEGVCAIHPMRPMACRQFNVFGRACSKGEDPYYTRREDVLPPVKKYVDQAFYLMLPFHGVEKESERIKVVESGAIHGTVRVLQTCNWKSLAEKMHHFDSGNRE